MASSRSASAEGPTTASDSSRAPLLTSATVCRDSGRLPRPGCPRPVEETLRPEQVPAERCDLHRPGWNRPRRDRPDPLSWLERKLKDIFD